jgi:hypothetical protein
MPMPDQSAAPFVFAVLGEPGHKLPIPGTAMLFPAEGRLVDSQDAYWRLLLADGSLKVAPLLLPSPPSRGGAGGGADPEPAAPPTEPVAPIEATAEFPPFDE